MLSGEILEEINPTTPTGNPTTQEDEPYDIQIQGSDRTHPAVVLRRKHRGKGATILTISRTTLRGVVNPLYDDYEGAIREYLARREQRQHRQQDGVARPNDAGGIVVAGENWLAEAVQSVVTERGGQTSP